MSCLSFWRFVLLVTIVSSVARGQEQIVIAHRGACGYLPEHTLAAKALAYGMGANYLEQDVVLSKDNHPIVMHDIHLDTVTDVARVFPGRSRDDGRFYTIDFTLAEIRQLGVSERIDLSTSAAVYPRRFPVGKSSFQVATLEEEIELIQGLNKSTGRDVGIYPEIKSPAWHRAEGKDISRIVLQVLADYGYTRRSDRVFVQCFDAAEARRLRVELGTQLPIIQLIGQNDWKESETDYEQLRTRDGITSIARYADGIGPWMNHVIRADPRSGKPVVTELVETAHAHGLKVHPYTLRADKLPAYAATFDELLGEFFDKANVDGVFTDFPDHAVRYLNRMSSE